jgi:tRNA-2-methylthio-N6-dimethylallyladenosine synthase
MLNLDNPLSLAVTLDRFSHYEFSMHCNSDKICVANAQQICPKDRAMSESKKLYIKTYGCQMNVYDSERMVEALGGSGYVETQTPDDADMILLNTCHIREKAAEKVYSELGRYKTLKSEKPDLKIGVAGCVAQAEGEEIMRRQPMVDLVVGPQSYHRLPELEAKAGKGSRAIDTDFPEEDKFEHLKRRPKAKRAPAAFLTVQEGCDKFCAFCVVPYTRGAEVSRPAERILQEARDLVERGVREITLLGQNVNAYHGAGADGDEWTLARLIWELDTIDGLERIRFTTSHPNDMQDDLIEAHGTCKKLMPYLHLPVQSGSDKILKRMNRSHDAQSYVKLIERIREARHDILISGDFIVGFPEETDQDFEDTMNLIREVEYGQAFSFKYSTRPGTPAAERDQLPEDVKAERLHRLQALITEQQRTIQDSMLGREVSVLFERAGRFEGQMVGKSEYLHAVHVTDPTIQIGDIRRVRITQSNPNSLDGQTLN